MTLGSLDGTEKPAEPAGQIAVCKAGKVHTYASPFFRMNPAPNPEPFLHSTRLKAVDAPTSKQTVRSARWLVVELPAGVIPHVVHQLRRYLTSSFEHWLLGAHESGMLALVYKDRSAWSPPSIVVASQKLSTVESPARQGRAAASESAYATVSSVLAMLHYAVGTLDTEAESSAPSTSSLDDVFAQVVEMWTHLSEDDIDKQVAVAHATEKDNRTAMQRIIVSGTASLRRVTQRQKAMASQMKMTFDSPSIPPLGAFKHLDAIMCRTFDPVNGELLECSILQYLQSGAFVQRGLCLLGGPKLGKTPLALAVCRIACHAWSSSSPGHFVVSTSLDALRLCTNLYQEGCGVVLDDWAPKTCRNGRNQRCSADELKSIFSCSPGRQIPTRYQDTCLPTGPRLCTTNALTMSEWSPIMRDDWLQLSPKDRLNPALISADCAGFPKRLCSAILDRAGLPAGREDPLGGSAMDERAQRSAPQLPPI